MTRHRGPFPCWYRGGGVWDGIRADRRPEPCTCYAESRDGIHWERPVLGIHETRGIRGFEPSRDNNISVNGPYSGGELLTRPLKFEGRELVLNYATSAAGSLRVEVQDTQGRPAKGHALTDCREMIGDEIERIVTWKSGSDPGWLSGKPVRLRFALKDSDLYSIRFRT